MNSSLACLPCVDKTESNTLVLIPVWQGQPLSKLDINHSWEIVDFVPNRGQDASRHGKGSVENISNIIQVRYFLVVLC